ncbi:MAG: alkaline phosphatase family protein [Blastocatellia bacterium]|nr:alkaline phosphatase family protein [Blastocatellia bacterium]
MPVTCAIIGLDGATFDLINPLIAAGRLPTLARLMREGVSGPLRSTILPNSFPGWASCTTGTSEGMHGIFSPFLKRAADYGVSAISSRDIRTRPIWDILAEHGKTSGVVNIPTSYPVEMVSGYQVTGMLTPSIKSQFTHPAALREEILNRFPGYIIEPRRALNRAEKAEEFRSCLAGHGQVSEYLLERYPTDFFMLVLSVPDRAQHDFWADMDASHFRYDPVESPAYSDFIREIYERADWVLGRLLEFLPPDVTLLVCSDHGFTAELRELRVNEWLAQQGFLRYREAAFQAKNSPVEALAAKLTYHYRALSTKLKPHSVLEKKVVFGKDFLNQIDWEQTIAYFGQDKGVWINLQGRERAGIVAPEDFEKVRQEVRQSLLSWKDPETGACVFEAVLPREELLAGRFADRLPDLLVIPRRAEDVCLESPSPGAPIIPATTTTGTHAPEGIFIAHGPQVRRGQRIAGAHLRDVAPTALFAMDVPLTLDMDGKPLLDIFEPELVSRRAVRRVGTSYKDGLTGPILPSERQDEEVFSSEESAELEERLRALGYLG